MIRISTIFIAICMVLVAASLGLILYSVLGISGSESAIVALTALTFLILYNAVSMRLRDRTDVGGQIADLSRGTADLARQVAEFGRRLAAVEGRVVSARASRGEDYLRATLATDEGASRLGEIGIGTNFGIDRAVGAILFDEKIGGTVHLAVGRAYPESGGTNESAVHWDMICDLRSGGRLSADGETILEDGRFT